MNLIKNKNIKSLVQMLATYKKKHIIAMFFSLINSGLVLLQPILLMKIIDNGIMQLDIMKIIYYVIFYMVVVLLQNLVNIIVNYLYSSIGKTFIYDLRIKLLKHIQKQSGEYQTSIETGELFTVFDNDIDNIEEVASSMIFSIFSDIIVSVVMCMYLCYLQPDLFIVIIILQPIMYFTQKKYNKMSNEQATEIRELLGGIAKDVQEFFSSIMQFIKMNAQQYFWNKYDEESREYTNNSIRLDFLFSKSISIASILSNMTMCIIFGYGGYKVIIGAMSIGGLITFNQYSQKLFTPILKIVQYSIQLKKTVISINKVYGIFQDSQEVVQINPYYNGKIIRGEIIFQDIYFSYDHKRNIYNGLNLHIIPGVFNGIVGESGEGKSTIINLLMRLWDVEKGEIVIDGVAIKRYQVDLLRKSIALVTQDSFLVNDSIEKNLTLLNPNISMEKIVDATVKAGIFDYIDSLPERFNTMVGENGIKLSGGQKQRIAIARVLLQNTPIIILDEATAALDNNVEAHVIESFYEVLSGKTVIIISHRLSIIKNCANINVIKQGRVSESGTHEQLMAYNQEYRRLYNKNFN